jgi:hypothetical protein
MSYLKSPLHFASMEVELGPNNVEIELSVSWGTLEETIENLLWNMTETQWGQKPPPPQIKNSTSPPPKKLKRKKNSKAP